MKTNMINVLNELDNGVFGQNFETFVQQDNNVFTGNQHERFRLIRTNNTVANNLNLMLDELCNRTNPVRQLIQDFQGIPTGMPDQNGPEQTNGNINMSQL